MLNGILLSTTEPDRKSFSFDLIPSNMIDNIVINKAFVPELPGEWAGGLIQVNTKDIPSKGFFNIQIGTGFNTQTHGKDFYTYQGGKLDWLGFDDGTRKLPSGYTTKNQFDVLTDQQKVDLGKQFNNSWSAQKGSAPINTSLQMSGGFNSQILGKKVAAIFGVNYTRNNRFTKLANNGYAFPEPNTGGTVTTEFEYNDDRYSQDVVLGGLANITAQLNPNNKVSWKALFNVNTTDYTTLRSGVENFGGLQAAMGSELSFRQNTFFNTQVSGDHNLPKKSLRFKWYGSFNILDGYIPDQRRTLYVKEGEQLPETPFKSRIASTLSQRNGNRYYQFLNDYVYTAGGDLAHNFILFGQKQTVKGGYMLQVKDRIFDAKPFSVTLPRDNEALRLLTPDVIFSPENFGDGTENSNLFAFDAIKGSRFRYIANTILNAGFLQFDNQLTNTLRMVWGLRVENYDQLVGSAKKSDPRHTYSKVTDYLPGVNITYQLNNKTNLRLSGSQTVVRPEFRELATFQYYDFDLNAGITGNPNLKRTKITNLDLRYEIYPQAGELLTAGVFFKQFDKPIEQIFSLGGGGSSSFRFENPDKATAYGAEVEFRKKLAFISDAFRNFTFQSNLAYVNSRVEDTALLIDRPLQGQSPYVLNFGLMYDLEKQGFSATVLYNQIGKRIAFVGENLSPDVWEASRPVLDAQVTKKFFKNKGEVRLNVSDILNRTLYFYQNADGNTTLNKGIDPYRFTRRFGSTVSLTVGYNF
jgi:outer membrane receptor protein involved in Fe transport